jgi:hypothetical protein
VLDEIIDRIIAATESLSPGGAASRRADDGGVLAG